MIQLLILAICAQLGQPATVEHPRYRAWAKFPPGSWVKMTTSEVKGMSLSKRTQLVSIDAKELVLENRTILETLGDEEDSGPVEERVPARIPAETVGKVVDKGEGEIEVAGKKMKLRWELNLMEKGKPDGDKMKIWYSDEIPGSVARREIITGTGKPTIFTATQWEVAAKK